MTHSLRILFLEDSEDDVFLMIRQLERNQYTVTFERVETEEDFRKALATGAWDLVISDYSLPGLNALAAIQVFKQSNLDIPFLVVSGAVGEETAVEVLKSGAHDVLIKNNLARLAPAVERELREVDGRRARHMAETALKNSELKFRRIVETAQEGIWLLDPSGKTTYMNRRMADMLGIKTEADSAITLREIIVDPRIATAFSEKLRGDAAGDTPYRTQCRLRRVDGSALWGLLAVSTITDDGRAVLGHLAMIFDITDHRRLQEQLMVSDRMASVGMLAAGVAHEINNPLAAVLTNLHMAIETIPKLVVEEESQADRQEILEEMEDAQEASTRLRDIIRDLKIFSRSPETRMGSVEIPHILDSAIRMAWNELKHKAHIVKDYTPIPPVRGDESRMGQLFLNLIVNAVQAMPEGRANENTIAIATRLDGKGRVEVSIRDTGMGMTPEVIAHLFTPFFTTKPIGVGTGLGLSICNRIVQALDGEITVESEIGKGTTFHVFLPAAEAAQVVRRPERPHRPMTSLSARILVIDDEPIVGTAIKRVMGKDHLVVTETSARRAFERISNGEMFDIILCDLMMPDMTGADFHAELFKLSPERADSIIFMTGGAFTPKAHAFLDTVENDRLEKPFDMVVLKSLVQDHLVGREEDAQKS